MQHLRLQYNALFPSLSRRYPLLFPKELYGWDMFLWACELWYSNGLKISYPDGSIKTCLVPMAGILNHGLYPHITHYSKVDSKSQKLVLRAARPCKAGQQCFLHYGSFSNSHLLTFYGFLFHKDNPFDYVPWYWSIRCSSSNYTGWKIKLGVFSHDTRKLVLQKSSKPIWIANSSVNASPYSTYGRTRSENSLCSLVACSG